MRILMISDVYFPRINGVSTSIKLFRQTLLAMGHDVTLIAPDYGVLVEKEQGIVRIPARKVVLDPEDMMMQFKSILDLLPQLREEEYDLIHIHSPFVAHYAGIKLAKALGIPCVETYHTFFEEYLYHYFPIVPRSWMRYLARHFTRNQCNAVDRVITPSTAMQAVLVQYGVTTEAEIIPTGIELDELRQGNGKAFREKHGIDRERPVIVHVGRVAHEKNIDFLLTMLGQVRKKINDVLMVIAGEGPALAHLKKVTARLGLQDNVKFIGYLSRDGELLDCYCCGDAFVFSSRTETQGLVLLEAMALGVPVVSTAVMGTKDILAPQKGALVANEEPQEFADKVHQVLSNRDLRSQLSTEAVQYVRGWTAQAMADRLLMFYQGLIEEQSQTTEIKSTLATREI